MKLAIVVAAVATAAALFKAYPGKRVISWFEVATDAKSLSFLSEDATLITGSLWDQAFRHGYVGRVVDVVANTLRRKEDVRIVELAAGDGVAAVYWNEVLQTRGVSSRSLLTDIMPKLDTWEVAAENNPNISFVSSPVDATSTRNALEHHGFSVRMMHLSLHHMPPTLASNILCKSLEIESLLVVGDLAPNLGGVVFNGLLAFVRFLNVLPNIVAKAPFKLLLLPFMPVVLFIMYHDATVSVLRSYSKNQLIQMVGSCDLSTSYDIRTFSSVSYAEYIGIPAMIPILRDPVMNFLVAAPTGQLCAKATNCTTVYPTEASFNYHSVEPATENTLVLVSAVMVALVLYLVYNFVVGAVPSKRRSNGRLGEPAILAIGLANPDFKVENQEASYFASKVPNYPREALDFFQRINANNGIDSRYVSTCCKEDDGPFTTSNNPSVTARNNIWKCVTKDISIKATNNALKRWGGNKNKITHVIFHSCTGFKAPGIELDVVQECKLGGVKRRLGINFMGCFGGFTGMAVAKSFVEADPEALVLLVCAEVCSAHFTTTTDRSKSIGNSIFGDGAAAVVIGPGEVGDWAISSQTTTTLGKETRDDMTWAPSDGPYHMHLSKNIGTSLVTSLLPAIMKTMMKTGVSKVKSIEWCIHPGGRKLLDIFGEGGGMISGLGRENLEHSYETLRHYGNMSSPTIFFVIQRMLQEQSNQLESDRKSHAICIGFGPGLTIEMATLRRIEVEAQEKSVD